MINLCHLFLKTTVYFSVFKTHLACIFKNKTICAACTHPPRVYILSVITWNTARGIPGSGKLTVVCCEAKVCDGGTCRGVVVLFGKKRQVF